MNEKTLKVSLEMVNDYEMRIRFDERWPALIMDEPGPLGKDMGPNAARVLSAAIGNCLSASLLFCLRKSHINPASLKAEVETQIERAERGRMRIGRSHVTITIDANPDDRSRMERCMGLFEDYCIVTASVRRGIPVDVLVRDQHGAILHHAPAEESHPV